MNDSEFIKYQQIWNEDNVESERFLWQTRNRIISQKERKLLMPLEKYRRKKILEVGCGEGANSMNMKWASHYTGCDYSASRIRFARKHSRGKFMVADGTKLPYNSGSFDVIFCRDVIHHLRRRKKFISEMYRVCRSGGSVILIESSTWNPVNIVFSFVHPKERDMRKIHPRSMKRLLSEYGDDITYGYSEAYNLDRLFFHYRFGFAGLANFRFIRFLNDMANAVIEFVLPKAMRAYMIIEIRKGRGL